MPSLNRVDWGGYFAGALHPTQVAILHAAEWIGEPLAPRDMEQILEEEVTLSNLSYHFRRLGEFGIIEVVEAKPVRGTVVKFWRPVGQP